jgi:hypothetical protein
MTANGPMPDDTSTPAAPAPDTPARTLTPAAERALAEAAVRRAQREAEARQTAQQELGGRAGPDPVRYGDWENGGIASDF